MKKKIVIALAAILTVMTAGCGRNEEALLQSQQQEESNGALTVQTEESSAPTETEMSAPAQTETSANPSETASTASSQAETAVTPETPVATGNETGMEWKDITLDIKKGTLYIRFGDSLSLTHRSGEALDYSIDNGTLYVSINHSGEMVLTLPENSYETLRLDVENGHVYAEDALSLTSLALNLEEGEVKLEALSVSDNSSIYVEKGSAFLYGDLGSSIWANCEEGHLSLSVPYKQDDYNYEIQLSGGDIRLGSKNYHGKTASETIDNGAAYSMQLNCSRGDISVSF